MYIVISRDQCNFCDLAKVLLMGSGIAFKEYNVQQNPWLLTIFKEAGYKTVPQIFDDTGKNIGGCDDLKRLLGVT